MFFRRISTKRKEFNIPIISIGNLVVGGSGKTPFIISLASNLKVSKIYIISRGYGRRSRGLIEVSRDGEILTDIYSSGDEAMLMAKSLSNVSIVVSESRERAIRFAKRRGAKIILLDDGFNRVEIKKFEILLFPKNIRNYFPIPAGAFRELYWTKSFANLNIYEDIDFKRVVTIQNRTDRMLLVTAISNPKRLDEFIPKNSIVAKIYLQDHSFFNIDEIEREFKRYGATSLLVTEKDLVKLEKFKLPISVLNLKLELKEYILEEIYSYIDSFGVDFVNRR
jgi:tetraacyldisaccharide 4'-kinase